MQGVRYTMENRQDWHEVHHGYSNGLAHTWFWGDSADLRPVTTVFSSTRLHTLSSSRSEYAMSASSTSVGWERGIRIQK